MLEYFITDLQSKSVFRPVVSTATYW